MKNLQRMNLIMSTVRFTKQKHQKIQNNLKAINEEIELRGTNEAQSAVDGTSTIKLESSFKPGSTNRISKVRTLGNFALREKQSSFVMGSTFFKEVFPKTLQYMRGLNIGRNFK